ncbi:hypothetical protein [Actinomadura fibrosa]|uniref:Uncharacterized protein n=1 Tax=Actinomadura fibrosa TaxID=111802 RepID=A0ABW2Y086_9ACTN|nr:hypothetical protein [Actinomadura fibrosa]
MAVLNRGAAGDAAARDRFRAAINAAVPGAGRVASGRPGAGPGAAGPGGFGPGGAGRGGSDGAAPVLAAHPDGPAPWVATVYEPDRAGAERFLASVLLEGTGRGRWGRRRGPQFQPYWLGSGEPALARPVASPVPGPAAPGVVERPPERSLVTTLLTLAAALVVLALLMGVLFACQPRVKEPPPPPPEPTPSTPAPTRTPVSPSPLPTPSSPVTTPAPSDGAPLF